MSELNLQKLLSPESVAVIGASERYESPGSVVILNMLGRKFSGQIYPINPRYESIHGINTFKSVSELPEPPDCVLICVNAGMVPGLLREAAEAGAGAAVIYASGFKETRESGADLQAEIEAISKKYELPFCGPNCIGPVNFLTGFTGFSANVPTDYSPGNVSAVCQSGSVAIALLNSGRGIDFRYLISSGNEAAVSVEDYFDYLLDDEGTDVVLGFVESFKAISKLRRVAAKARRRGKTIALVKVGRTEFAQRTVVSHTGALAGEDSVIDALLNQIGIVRSLDLNELLETAILFRSLPPPGDNRVGMVAISGGEIGLLSDLCSDIGIQLPELDESTADKLRETLPPYSPIANPIDAWGNGDLGETFRKCIEAAGTDPGFDSVVVGLDVQSGMSDKQADYYSIAARSIVDATENIEKPVVVFSNLGSRVHPAIEKILYDASIPILQGTVPSLRAVSQWVKQSQFIKPLPGSAERSTEALDFAGKSSLTEHNARGILKEWGIPLNQSLLANSFSEAKDNAEKLGYPLALKVDSPEITHRYKVGAIALNIPNEEELEKSYNAIMSKAAAVLPPESDINGVSVQKMVDSADAIEVLVGIHVDPQCGPVIMLGLGGVHAEVFQDTVMRLAPLSENDAHAMIAELRSAVLFEQSDREALVEVLMLLSDQAIAYQDQIAQLEINPLLVFPEGQGVLALDALIIAADSSDGQ